MSERVILLNSIESHLNKPPGSAAYEFADVSEDHMPAGNHELVGTLNGTPVYLADPCLDMDTIAVDGVQAFSSGHVRLWDNAYSSTQWDKSLSEFEGFDADELGRFIEDNHERMTDDNALRQEECHVVSKVEPETPVPGVSFGLNLNHTA